MRFSDYFKEKYSGKIPPSVKITYRDDLSDSNNIGTLSGVDLDSDLFSGYIYYWDKGYFDFMLFNLQKDEEEIATTIHKTKQFDDDLIDRIVKYFSK